MIEIADSWEGRDGGPTVTIPLSGIESGDLLVVVAFAFGGSGVPSTPIDDAAFSNIYTERRVSTVDATFEAAIAVFDAIVDTVPTSIEVSNSAGGTEDIGAVVLRVTHNGTAYYNSTYSTVFNTTADDPSLVGISLPDTSLLGSGVGYRDNGAALVIAGISHDGATTTMDPEAGWAEAEEEEDASGGVPYSVVSRVYTETADVTHQWTTGASRDYCIAACTYTENIPELVQQFVTVAPSPPVTGATIEVSGPTAFPDPAVETFFILVHPPPVGSYFLPDMHTAEILAVTGITGTAWDIERAEAGTKAQAISDIYPAWWVWWDHILSLTPLDLMTYVHSLKSKSQSELI